MSKKRRRFSGVFKAKAALAAVRGDKTTAELAAEFGVDAHQDRLAVEEDLVEAARDHQNTTRLIQAAEDSAGRICAHLHPSRDLRPTGAFF